MKHVLHAAAILILCAASALAQQPPGPDIPPDGGMTPAEIQKLFDAYIVVEAQRALELGDAQYPQFIARLRMLQDTRRRTTQERIRLMGQLQRLTAPRVKPMEGYESTLEGLLKQLQELEARTAAEMRKAYNELDQVLDIRQQARFRVLEEQIERRKIELLMRARQQRPRPKVQ